MEVKAKAEKKWLMGNSPLELPAMQPLFVQPLAQEC